MTQIAVRSAATVRLTFVGQSMLFLPPAPIDVPWMVASTLGLETEYTNIGHAGEGWDDLYSDRFLELVSQPRNRDGCTDVLVMIGGQGDILNDAPSGGQDAATCYTRTVRYADAARTAGFHYVVGCTLPAWADGFYPITAEQTATKDALNVLLAASNDFDAIAHLDLVLTDATDTNLYLFDELHLALPGGRVLAREVASAVTSALAGDPVDPFTGGTATDSGGYRYRTFTSSGTLTPTVSMRTVDYLVKAGGGGGARSSSGTTGGGGGDGGQLSGSLTLTAAQTVTVGNGGPGATADATDGTDGGDSSIGSLVVATGGGGGDGDGGGGRTGGSGGGGRGHTAGSAGGSATTGQGYAGGAGFGSGTNTSRASGGGGGAGAVGADAASATGGAGGVGRGWYGTLYGGGGGGGTHTGTPGAGGSPGGGAGGNNAAGTAGTANTGGGGGGGGRANNGGNGGSGIVIVRYRYPA